MTYLSSSTREEVVLHVYRLSLDYAMNSYNLPTMPSNHILQARCMVVEEIEISKVAYMRFCASVLFPALVLVADVTIT